MCLNEMIRFTFLHNISFLKELTFNSFVNCELEINDKKITESIPFRYLNQYSVNSTRYNNSFTTFSLNFLISKKADLAVFLQNCNNRKLKEFGGNYYFFKFFRLRYLEKITYAMHLIVATTHLISEY